MSFIYIYYFRKPEINYSIFSKATNKNFMCFQSVYDPPSLNLEN